jgi:transketolase
MQVNSMLITYLERKTKSLRKNIIKMLASGQAGHPGGSLSVVEIITVLYYYILKIDPQNPDWEERDRVVLSKGHASPALYAALGDLGFFDTNVFETFDHINSILQAHPDMSKTPGVDMSTGSLGQGLSAAVGMALGGKLDRRDFNVYVILGDGELQSGQIWEAAMFAAHRRLNNLIAILDYNKLQLYGEVSKMVSIEPIKDKWQAFGWHVVEGNGHDFKSLIDLLTTLKDKARDCPSILIAHTIKGKGISFMENRVEWHARAMNLEEIDQALSELG